MFSSRLEHANNDRVFDIVTDPNRQLVMSPFQELEVLPSVAPRNRRAFLQDWMQIVSTAIVFNDLQSAFDIPMKVREAGPHISAMDALHIAAAYLMQCDELVTTESQTKPMFGTRYVSVVHVPKA